MIVRRGFTLLEVLLTSVLTATLLAGLWSLLSTYTKLFETGQTRTEQAQLVRSLMRQFSDDLRSAIQDTASRPPQTAATTPLRRFGLFGTSTSLQLDIMRVAPLEDRLLRNSEAELSTIELAEQEKSAGPKAPEFRTVHYTFEAPADTFGVDAAIEGELAAESEAITRRPGLSRRELDWELPGAAAEQPWEDPRLRSAIPDPQEANSSDPLADQPLEDLLVDEELTYVPEVVSLEFRYFDGSGWTSSWNSIQNKSLPAAVEIHIQVQPIEEVQKKAEAGPLASEIEFVEEQNPSDLNRLTAESEPAVHRMVIYLPISPLQRPPQAAGTLTQRIREGMPNRAVERLQQRRDRYRRPSGASSGPPADQHLRAP